MQLFLVRHGESEWNAQHLFQGQHHSRLTVKGKQQAKRVAKWIAQRCQPDLLLSSDLRRAVETAQLIGKMVHLKPRYTKLMRERALGNLEGKTTRGKQTEQDHYLEAGKGYLPVNAERLAAIKQRARKVIAIILKSKKHCVVLVGHEAINSFLANALLRRRLQTISQNHTQVHWFKLNAKGKVEKYKLTVSVK